MLGGDGNELLRILSKICSELAHRPAEEWLVAATPTFGAGDGDTATTSLSPEDEAFAVAMRQALAEIASAAGAASLSEKRQRSTRVALDGVELVIRGQLAMETPEQLRVLLPSFVFLIVLPILQQDEALAISQRVGELVR